MLSMAKRRAHLWETGSMFIAILALGLVISTVSTPARADLEADAETCLAKETPPAERVTICQRLVDGETLNEKQMVVALYALGHAHLSLGNTKKAIEIFGKAIERAPDEVSIIASRSQAYLQLREFDAAINDLTRALALKPDFAPLLSNRGNAYAGKGDHEHALADFSESIRLQPGLSQPHAGRGRSFLATGEYQKAIDDFTLAIEIGLPAIAPVYQFRGMAYVGLRRDTRAIEDFDEALRRNPDLTEAYFHRGAARARLGVPVAARKDLERVTARYPNHLGANYALAGVDQSEGKYESAIKRYDRILSMSV